jgi:hypothetical protein
LGAAVRLPLAGAAAMAAILLLWVLGARTVGTPLLAFLLRRSA